MRRIAIAALAFFLIAGAGACMTRQTIAKRLVERRIESNLTSNQLDEFEDGLHVVLCGAGAPLPDPDRSGPCVAVVAGNALYIVDAGSGSSRSLSRLRIPQGQIAGVLLTHFHSDHIDGIGELMMQRWVNAANTSPTPVHGPEGVAEVVDGFNRAYAQDARYRAAHHGDEVAPITGAGGVARAFATPAGGDGAVIVDADGLRITAFSVDHAPVSPAVGYRFDYAGRSVVVSGDTSKSANVQRFAAGVDLLVHEALSPELVGLIQSGAAKAGNPVVEKIAIDIPDYHTTPVEAAEIARDAEVGQLLFYHVVPPLPISPLESVFLDGVDDVYDGKVTLGVDGSFVSLPANSKKVETGNLL